MWDGHHIQLVDPGETRWVDGEEWEVVGDGDGCDQCVVRAGRGFASVLAQARYDATIAPGGRVVERQRDEVGFGGIRSSGASTLNDDLVPTSTRSVPMAAEEPEFVLIEKDGDYELRQYAPMIVAETLVQGPLEQASPAGFEPIAGYIFGDNRARTGTSTATIAMTAPVTIEPDTRPIAMTAPVTMQQDAGRWRMRFFMPSSLSMATLPIPTNPAVTLRELPGENAAAVVFSGAARDEDVKERSDALLAWLATRELEPVSVPRLARYDRPTTAPDLRRNEILVEYR